MYCRGNKEAKEWDHHAQFNNLEMFRSDIARLQATNKVVHRPARK